MDGKSPAFVENYPHPAHNMFMRCSLSLTTDDLLLAAGYYAL